MLTTLLIAVLAAQPLKCKRTLEDGVDTVRCANRTSWVECSRYKTPEGDISEYCNNSDGNTSTRIIKSK